MKNFVTILVLTLNLQFCLCDTSSNLTTVPPTISDLNIIKNVVSDYTESTTTTTMTPSSKSAGKQKPLYSTGNELWDNLIRDCLKKPTFSCIQKNVYTFLDSTLNQNDVNVTSRVQLTRNQLEYKISQTPKDEENEIYFEGRGKLRSSLLTAQLIFSKPLASTHLINHKASFAFHLFPSRWGQCETKEDESTTQFLYSI